MRARYYLALVPGPIAAHALAALLAQLGAPVTLSAVELDARIDDEVELLVADRASLLASTDPLADDLVGATEAQIRVWAQTHAR